MRPPRATSTPTQSASLDNMPKTYRPSSAVLALVMVVALAAPAGADSLTTSRQKRDATRSRRAQIAAQINSLKATDDQLEKAVHALEAQVRAQQAGVDAANQAVQAARASQLAAEAQLAATNQQISRLHRAVVTRAVTAYMSPRQDDVTGVFRAKNIGDASRRGLLLAQVSNGNADTIDQLRAARDDRALEQAAAARARAVAADRQRAADARLAELKRAEGAKLKLAVALRDRIASFETESAQLASIESSLSRLIQSKEASARASRGGSDVIDGRVSGAGLIWPLRGTITSEFGPRWGGFHPGIDIAAPSGTPIHAAKGGTVILAGWEGGYGNYTCISHGGGFSTCYAHQSRIAVSDGQTVSQGEVIGYEGSTGNSTGPHLHFETRVDGNPQNPRRYLP